MKEKIIEKFNYSPYLVTYQIFINFMKIRLNIQAKKSLQNWLSIKILHGQQFNVIFFFSSPLVVHGNYCHHLASVVCKLFTFQASSPKPLGQLKPNLAGMFLGWSSTNFLFFVPVGYSTWLPGPIICSDWLKFQRSSSLKLMN